MEILSEKEIWQVDVKGQIYETDFVELTHWIGEGAVLRDDLVRRGNLRWLEAGKIPKLIEFFNAKDQNVQPPAVSTTVFGQPDRKESAVENEVTAISLNESNYPESRETFHADQNTEVGFESENCVFHIDSEPFFTCDGCAGKFCKACPKKYGGTVRTCPSCGSLCRPIEETSAKSDSVNEKFISDPHHFGFGDLSNALVYPFQFKTSLIFGALMFALFSVGQKASAIGGIIMLCAAIFCVMLANMLTFGVLANTVDNFSQGKIGGNFMPSFDDFELWNDVIQPFFLSIAAYIVSFGLFLLIVVGGIWYAASSVSALTNGTSSAVMSPADRANLEMAKSAPEMTSAAKDAADRRVSNDEDLSDDALIAEKQRLINHEEAEFAELQKMIDDHRKGQIESVTGPTDEAKSAQMRNMFSDLAAKALPFILFAILAVFWGIFYFPAACLVAGYTRSFSATINPLIGLDTIKRLGWDYAKILLFGFLLLILSSASAGFFTMIFSPLDLPIMGNLPAVFASSFIAFYISVVFSIVLGFAMYKNSDKFAISARRI